MSQGALNPKQFSVIAEPTPQDLAYRYDKPWRHGAKSVDRLAIKDAEAPVPGPRSVVHFTASHSSKAAQDALNRILDGEAFAPEIKVSSSKVAKTKVVPNTNVSDPTTVAFVDYHHSGPNSIYINMVRSRQRGYHHASRLIHDLSDRFPGHTIDFGRVMNSGIWAIKESLEAKGRSTNGYKYFTE